MLKKWNINKPKNKIGCSGLARRPNNVGPGRAFFSSNALGCGPGPRCGPAHGIMDALRSIAGCRLARLARMGNKFYSISDQCVLRTHRTRAWACKFFSKLR